MFFNMVKKNKCFFLIMINMENVCMLDYKVIVIKIFIFRIFRNKVELLFFLCNWIICLIIYLVRDFCLVVFFYMKVGIKIWLYFRGFVKDGVFCLSVKMYSV